MSPGDVGRLLGGLGAMLVVDDGGGGAALLRCELRLYMTEPAHPQSSNAIRDLANVFGGVFLAFLWGFHFEPNDNGSEINAARKKSPGGELGGLGGLGWASDLGDQNSSRDR
jgi:hypothetical protein